MTATLDSTRQIRDVTDDEVAFLQENGWVKLDSLISPDFIAELLEAAQEPFEALKMPAGEGVWNAAAVGGKHALEPFASFVNGEQMRRNAERLINRSRLTDRHIPARLWRDTLIRKDPRAGLADPSERTGGTPFHQDSPEHGSDRHGEVNFWIALDEVTPEMGSMHFVGGTHREGPLGAGVVLEAQDFDTVAQYPKLLDLYELSPQMHYQPGDATVHCGYTLHGAPKNQSDRARWAYIVQYYADDVRFTPPSNTARAKRRIENHEDDIPGT